MTGAKRGAALALLAGVGGFTLALLPRSPARPPPTPGTDSAAGWPHPRGPRYDGVAIATGLADRWPAEGPPVLWHVELGQGYSGIVAVGSRLYTQAQTAAGQQVLCLDADTGATLWSRRYDWPWKSDDDYPGPYSTPTWSNGRIYFAGTDGTVGCLDAANGRWVWRLEFVRTYGGEGTEFGYACTPLVSSGKVVLPAGGSGNGLVALDAKSGALVWRAGDGPASYSSALPLQVGAATQVVVLLQNEVLRCDLADGRILWREELSGGYDEHSCWPVWSDPHLFLALPLGGGSRLYRILPAVDAAAPVWEGKPFANDVLSSIALGGHVYGFNLKSLQSRPELPSEGAFECLELATGRRLWETTAVGHASVAAAEGKLFLLEDRGALVLARASPTRYEELGRAQVLAGSLCWTPPTLDRERIYVRNHRYAACVYVGTPERLEAAARAQARPASAAVRLSGAGVRRAERREALLSPGIGDLQQWYLACLATYAAAALPAGLAYGWTCRRDRERARRRGRAMFLAGSVALAAAVPWLTARLLGRVEFTWPAALYAAYAAMIAVAVRHASHLAARVAGVAVLCTACAAYAWACRLLSASAGIGFLVGLAPAWPFALWTARSGSPRSPGAQLVGFLAGFSAGYWASAAFILWKTGA